MFAGAEQVDQVLAAGAEGGLKVGPEARALVGVKGHALRLVQADAPHLGRRQLLGARQVHTPDLQQRRLELTKALRRQRHSHQCQAEHKFRHHLENQTKHNSESFYLLLFEGLFGSFKK